MRHALEDGGPAARRPYTAAEDHELLGLFGRGATIEETAVRLGRTWHSVQRRKAKLRVLGILAPARPPAGPSA